MTDREYIRAHQAQLSRDLVRARAAAYIASALIWAIFGVILWAIQ